MLAAAKSQVIRAAYHEAGHVVVGKHLTGERPQLVTIERGSENIDAPTSGFVRWRFHIPAGATDTSKVPPAYRKYLLASAECWSRLSLAGYAVEDTYGLRDGDDPFELFFAWDEEQDQDVVGAFEELRYFEKSEKKCWSWLNSLWEDTKDLVVRADIKKAIGDLAEVLLNTPTLDEDTLSRLLARVPFDISQMERPRARPETKAQATVRPKRPKTAARGR